VEVAVAPDVIAGRDDVGASLEDAQRELRSQPRAVRRVLAVDDAEVGAELVAELGQALLDGPPAGSAEDVCDEEDPQGR
jgi:hypothetical protein